MVDVGLLLDVEDVELVLVSLDVFVLEEVEVNVGTVVGVEVLELGLL